METERLTECRAEVSPGRCRVPSKGRVMMVEEKKAMETWEHIVESEF